MTYPCLRSFIADLEARGQLARVSAEIDPNQEITIIQHRVLARGGPALLFENVKGSPFSLVSNLFGTHERANLVFGGEPAARAQQVVDLAQRMMEPSLCGLWSARSSVMRMLRARMRRVRTGPIMQTEKSPPNLNLLPCLTCWPDDGGAFFTLPLVHTVDPKTGRGNLGIYRMQRFDATSTGMHWQIEKGGGFHFSQARAMNQALPVSVFLGGPPALTLAAIAPLPEGMDERLLAALIMGRPLEVIQRMNTGHRIPATAEFVIEGEVRPGDQQQEGPFGDHLGHYSHSSQFPVFRAQRMLGRRDAIFPATVVGKPRQEDFFIGSALQEFGLPLLRMLMPGIMDLWAFPETGFHPLAVIRVRERYEHEAMKHAMAILGHGQLSLTKVLVVVDADVNMRDFTQVSGALQRNLNAETGIHLLCPTAQDTLDFTGPKPNIGSRLILIATSGCKPGNARAPTNHQPPSRLPENLPPQVCQVARLGDGVLMLQVKTSFTGDASLVQEALSHDPIAAQYKLQVLVSPDVPLDDPALMLWGWFTRFDPAEDLLPARRQVRGNCLTMDFPLMIDARWKPGYRKPVAFDPDKEAMVMRRWSEYGIKL